MEGKYTTTDIYSVPDLGIDNKKEVSFKINYQEGSGDSRINIVNGHGDITAIHEIVQKKELREDYLTITEKAPSEIREDALEINGTLNTVAKAINANYMDVNNTNISDVTPEYIEKLGSLDRVDSENEQRVENDILMTESIKEQTEENLSELPAILSPPISVATEEVTNPQQLAILFLNDQNEWDIKEEKSYLGRDSYVIDGVVSSTLNSSVKSFEIIVDKETGTLLYANIINNENIYNMESTLIEVSEINFVTNGNLKKNLVSFSRLNLSEDKERDTYVDEFELARKGELINFFDIVLKTEQSSVSEKEIEEAKATYLPTEEEKELFKEYVTNNPEKVLTDLYQVFIN